MQTNQIATAIRVIMARKGITSRDIHAVTGFSKWHITRVRRGQVSPLKEIDKWAQALGVSVEDIINECS